MATRVEVQQRVRDKYCHPRLTTAQAEALVRLADAYERQPDAFFIKPAHRSIVRAARVRVANSMKD
jgi:hypothetical protein